MDVVLERRWERFTRRRDRMVAELGSWKAEELRARPGTDRWSALEVVDHLVRTDIEVLRMVEEACGTCHRVELRDRVRAWMVLAVMWLPTRVAMPKPVEGKVRPALTGDLAALRAEWDRVDAALHDRITALSEAEQRAGVARHPVSGWLSARGGVRFLESHLVHHGYQIARIRRAVRKNAGVLARGD